MLLIYRDGVTRIGAGLLDLMHQIYDIRVTVDRRVQYTPEFCQSFYTCHYSEEWDYEDMMIDAAKDIYKTAKSHGWVLFKEA